MNSLFTLKILGHLAHMYVVCLLPVVVPYIPHTCMPKIEHCYADIVNELHAMRAMSHILTMKIVVGTVLPHRRGANPLMLYLIFVSDKSFSEMYGVVLDILEHF